jgi:hypothetical protein
VQESNVSSSLARLLDGRDRATTPAPAKLPGGSESSLARLVVWTALLAIPAVTALQPISEYDTWWHLRTGQWVIEHGTVPTTDPFSTYGDGKPWVAYSWLFGLLLYGLYRGMGLFGIVLYRVVLAVAVVAALQRLVVRRQPHLALAAGLVAAAAVGLTPLLVGERPGLVTILFCTLTLDAVLTLREGARSRWVWLLPVCYVLWANIHVQFVHGLFLLGLACAAPLADRVLGFHRDGEHADTWGSRGWWQLVALTAACLLATLVNPYGVRLYTVVVEYARQKDTYGIFAELQAMDFREVSDWVVLGLTGAAAYALGRRERWSAFDVLLLAAAAYFSFRAKHDLWFVVLAACAVVAGTPHLVWASATPATLTWPQRLGAAAALVLIVAVTARQRDLSEPHLQAQVAEEFPVEAAAVIEERGYGGPVYNHFDWGGYLLWRLPRLGSAIDGRTNIHGDRRVKQFADTWEGRPGWERDPDLAAARLVVLQPRAPLAALLRRDSRFALVHEDPVAVVYLAQTAEPGAPASAAFRGE